MIVHRITWKMKHDCRDEFVALTKAMLEEAGVTHRVCSFIFGPNDVVIVDLGFETREDQQKHSWDWSKPRISEWGKKHDDLIEPGTVDELLRVH